MEDFREVLIYCISKLQGKKSVETSQELKIFIESLREAVQLVLRQLENHIAVTCWRCRDTNECSTSSSRTIIYFCLEHIENAGMK